MKCLQTIQTFQQTSWAEIVLAGGFSPTHLKNMLPLDGGDFIVVMNPMGSVESVKNHPFSKTNPRFWSWWLNPGVENSQKYLEKPPPSHGLSLLFFFLLGQNYWTSPICHVGSRNVIDLRMLIYNTNQPFM